MKKVNHMIHLPQINHIKEESLLSLSKEKHILDFLKRNHLEISCIAEYWVEFLDYDKDYKECLHCQGLSQCPKVNQGMRKNLVLHDGDLVLELQSCHFSQHLREKRNLLSHYVVTNMEEDMLLTELGKLNVVHQVMYNQGNVSLNTKKTIQEILSYIDNPRTQGFFLHGEADSEKTNLLAGLMNALARKNYDIGFVHFPTYLIDLKSSFSSGDSEYAIEKLMKVDYLLLDGIGEENVTPWSRDEILLTLLSYRLLHRLPTFFTSMYGYNDLKKVYTIKKGDEIRTNTLISKMKSLSIEIMLDGGKIR